MSKTRSKKAKKNAGETKGTESTKQTPSHSQKTNSATSTAKAKEREASLKVAEALKKINKELEEVRGSEWSDE